MLSQCSANGNAQPTFSQCQCPANAQPIMPCQLCSQCSANHALPMPMQPIYAQPTQPIMPCQCSQCSANAQPVPSQCPTNAQSKLSQCAANAQQLQSWRSCKYCSINFLKRSINLNVKFHAWAKIAIGKIPQDYSNAQSKPPANVQLTPSQCSQPMLSQCSPCPASAQPMPSQYYA